MTKPSRSRLENVTKCFSYYHLLWISSSHPAGSVPTEVRGAGASPLESSSAGGAPRPALHPFALLWAVVSWLTVFHNTGTKGLFNKNEGERDLKQMRVNTGCTIMSTRGFLPSADVKVLYKSGQYQYLCLTKRWKKITLPVQGHHPDNAGVRVENILLHCAEASG